MPTCKFQNASRLLLPKGPWKWASKISFRRYKGKVVLIVIKSECGYIKIWAHLFSPQQSGNKSRETAWVIRKMIEVTAEVIRAKLSLLSQRLSQLVGACWFFFYLKTACIFSKQKKSRGFCKVHT